VTTPPATVTLPAEAATALWRLYHVLVHDTGATEPCETCQGYGAVTQYDGDDARKIDDATDAIEPWEDTIRTALTQPDTGAGVQAAETALAHTRSPTPREPRSEQRPSRPQAVHRRRRDVLRLAGRHHGHQRLRRTVALLDHSRNDWPLY
jgi:hypothetical protein